MVNCLLLYQVPYFAVADKLDTFFKLLQLLECFQLVQTTHMRFVVKYGAWYKFAAFDWNIEIEDFTKLLLGLDYAGILSGKEDEIRRVYLKLYS